MATGGVYEELSSINSCDICFEPFKGRNPRTLDCLHVFCQSCIQLMLATSKSNKVRCPKCARVTNVPKGSASNLPIYFHYSKIEDLRRKLEQRHTVCQICKLEACSIQISCYCFVCCSGMCETCQSKHDKLYPDHSQIPVTSAMIGCMMCPDHDTHFDHFCLTCSTAVCSKCCVRAHYEHKVYALLYDSKKGNDMLKEFLSDGLRSADQSLARIDSLQNKVNADVKKTQEEMKQHRDDLVKEIDDEYQSLSIQLTKLHEDIKCDIAVSREQLIAARNHIKRLIKEAKALHEPVTGISMARVPDIEELNANLKCQMPSTEININKPRTVMFTSETQPTKLGHITEQALRLSYVMKVNEEEASYEQGQAENTSIPDPLPKDFSGKPKLKYQIKTEFAADMCYRKSGALLVLSNYDLSVYNEYGKKISHYLTGACKIKADDHLFCGICAGTISSLVAITESRGSAIAGSLLVYTPDGDSWRQISYDVCQKPKCVAMTVDGGFVVTSSKQILVKYDKDGSKAWDRKLSGSAQSVLVDGEDNVLVCIGDGVCMFDKRGNKSPPFSAKGMTLKPSDVCIDKMGNFMIADLKTKSLLLFSRKGELIRELIHFDFSPERIALFKDRLLAVGGNNPNIVRIYELT